METSYHNGWQGLFPERYAARALAPRKAVLPEWRVLQLLQDELKTLDNELAYDFDIKSKPAMVERRKIVRAQIQQLNGRG